MSQPSTSTEGSVAPPNVRRPRLMRQPNMWHVLVALMPVLAAGIYLFGWRVLAVVAASNVAGLVTEYLTSRGRGQPVSVACFVTCWLYGLSLPPTVPFWIVAVGAVVAILFGKEVFGGFGRNFANPAIVGRAFVYVCFPVELTGRFVPAFRGWPGGLVHWAFTSLERLPEHLASAGLSAADAVTSATPVVARRDFGYVTPLRELFLGDIAEMFQTDSGPRLLAAGSIGEVCALAILVGAAYLLVTRTANWRLMMSSVVGVALADVASRHLLGAQEVPPLLWRLASGAVLYASVFMVTEPVSAPKKRPAMYAYGFLIGVLMVVIAWKGQFPGSASFAILLGNTVAPLLDLGATAWADRRKTATTGGGDR